MGNSSVYKQITTLVNATTTSTSNLNVFSQNVIPGGLSVNTIYYIDGSDPMDLPISGLLTSSNGFVDISGYGMFMGSELPWISGATYPTS